ncbi:hypothetical protein C8F04DRAFT_1269179 [Mycena alexandri]|uniref:Uncharacterized protein n=1 Tax=Mycena alexandri TaxID=1745969 RepID=A0AAD6SDW4_9AGAR|nr:hypothetical protein C8F04DRAFT_1269179 [Mycena alexandri]
MVEESTTPPGSPPLPPMTLLRSTDPLPFPPTGDLPLPSTVGLPVPLDILLAPPMPDLPGPTVVASKKGLVPRRRHKKAEEKDVPGKESWVHGTKLLFFEHRKAEYLAVATKSATGDKQAAGAFYTKMARLYVIKYGYTLRDNEDLLVDVADPPDKAANEVVNQRVSPENDERAKYHKNLRNCIAEWYRRKYGGLLKTDKAAFKELFTGILDGAPAKPQRGQLLHCYSRHFFEERVKERYEERLASLKRRAVFTGEQVPKQLALQNAVTKEVWDEETPGFQKEVTALWEREYNQALKGWEASLADSPTRTPQELAASLENAAYYLQPFVDAVAQRFGMTASLLLCGPIGRNQGVVAEEQCRARAELAGLAGTSGPSSRRGSSGPSGPHTAASHGASTRGAGGSGSNNSVGGAGGRDHDKGDDGADDDGAAGDADSGAGGRDDGGGGDGDGGAGGGGADGGAGGGGADGGAGGGNEDDGVDLAAQAAAHRIERLWARTDRAEWTGELARAHTAFARGKAWGIEWARCVAGFFDFESVHGYSESKAQLPVANRPRAVEEWLGRGRRWDRTGLIGAMPMGNQDSEGVYAGGALSRPEKANWEELEQMNGKTGLLHVMGLLLWWGDYVGDGEDVFQYVDWTRAVEDVTWVLRQLEISGLITGEKVGIKRKRAKARGLEEPAAKVLRRSSRHEKADEGVRTRARVQKTPGEKEKAKGSKSGKKRGT